MKVQSDIRVYEVDDKELPAGSEEKFITVESHWNWKNMIVINTHGLGTVTVPVDDLKKAVHNARNH